MSQFIINSDYPMDKLVWLKEGQAKMNQWGEVTIELEHAIPAQIFVRGVWTIDNWETTYTFGTQRQESQYYTILSTLSADDNKVYLYASKEGAGNKDFKYRLWGVMYEQETRNVDVSPTASLSRNKFVINTDYKYPSLAIEGISDAGKTVYHHLGAYPFVDIWGKGDNTRGYEILTGDSFGSIYGSGEWAKLTTDAIIFSANTMPYKKYYFRIYMP